MRGFSVLLIISVLISFKSCYKEEVIFNAEPNRELELQTILRINGKECCYDYIENSLRFSINRDSIIDFSPVIEFEAYSEVYFEGSILQNNKINNLRNIKINEVYEIVVVTKNKSKTISLTFTNLPIVQIITPNRVFDEQKTIAKIVVNYPDGNKEIDEYFIGLEYRGGTSQNYEKKSYGLSIKGSLNLDDNITASFFGLSNNNDWILDAMWIDKSRMRNKTSFELWRGIDNDRHYGIRAKHVELYLNNEHQGIYCLSENINSEFLNLNNDNAVLYKAIAWEDGATRFQTYTNNSPKNYYWDGWEQKYPESKKRINWKPLDDLRNLVVNGSDEIFASQISSLIDINIFIDYYIFLNFVSAMDNTGKNTFLVKEDTNEKFIIIPWDIDGSWGLFWDGTQTSYTSILSNNIFDRLIETNTENFKSRLKQRWAYLRGHVFSTNELKNIFIDNFLTIKKSNIIDIENEKWRSNINIEMEQEYLLNWIENRVSFLDNYYDDL